jgi:hypothetical protein
MSEIAVTEYMSLHGVIQAPGPRPRGPATATSPTAAGRVRRYPTISHTTASHCRHRIPSSSDAGNRQKACLRSC